MYRYRNVVTRITYNGIKRRNEFKRHILTPLGTYILWEVINHNQSRSAKERHQQNQKG